jgi:site-specific DNA-methyltransferase (adenine-specific)
MRDKMETKVMFSSQTNEWGTPHDTFDELNKEFNFTIDVAASKDNHKCERYYTKEQDGLTQSWGGETVFLNPPYGHQIKYWIKKAYEESQKPNTSVVLLIPARTDTSYWHDYIFNKAEIRFIRGRLKFTNQENILNSAPFPSAIVIFRGKK